MILEGLRLTGVGMLTVFAFLSLLVAMMRASAAFFEANAHRFPEEEPGDKTASAAGDDELAVVLAVLEALRRGHRV